MSGIACGGDFSGGTGIVAQNVASAQYVRRYLIDCSFGKCTVGVHSRFYMVRRDLKLLINIVV